MRSLSRRFLKGFFSLVIGVGFLFAGVGGSEAEADSTEELYEWYWNFCGTLPCPPPDEDPVCCADLDPIE